VHVSYLEIYDEEVNDLLDQNRRNLEVKEITDGEVSVGNLSLRHVTCEEDLI
jgi:hypothetical protein